MLIVGPTKRDQMPDINILDRTVTVGNPWSVPAENPFYAGSILHPGENGPYSVRWTIEGFPTGGVAFLFGRCRIGDPNRKAITVLTVEVEQDGRRSLRSFSLANGFPNRFGIAFVNEGGAYHITYTVEVLSKGDLAGSVLEVEPLSCMQPIGESPRPKLYRMLDRGPINLVSCNQGGLMNRLVPLMSAMHIGREAGRSIYVWWGANNHCAAELPDLFEVPSEEIDASIFADDFSIYSNYETTPPLDLKSEDQHTIIHSILPIRTVSPELPNDHDTAAREFSKMRLAEPVRRKLAPFDDVDFSSTIGFHIRRPYPNGAFAEQERSKFTLGADVFVELIEKLNQGMPEYKQVLLCTNSPQMQAEVKAKFGDYVIVFEKTSIDNTTDPVAVQEALVDLTLMSRCPVLFSQETTAFGLFAHAIGRNKLFAVTSRTVAENYEFFRFERGKHVLTFQTPRHDISELIRLAKG